MFWTPGSDDLPGSVSSKASGRPLETVVFVPCSHCSGCMSDKALVWAIRSYQESTLHNRNCFVTLTYSDDCLPSDGKISKDEMQRFIKRVRKDFDVRYLLCGEYGDSTRRPHYHLLMFGQDFKSVHDVSINDAGDYSSSLISKYWPFGHNVVSPVSMATCCYVAGYVLKKGSDPDTFRLASRRPPIGKLWFEKFSDDVRRTGKVIIDGKSVMVPPQYFDWDDSGSLDDLKRERFNSARRRAKLNPKYRSETFEGLNRAHSRELNIKARQKLKGGKL